MPTHTVSQPDPQWYLAKMRDLYERDPQLLDPSWRAYFATESAPPQLRATRPAIPEAIPGALEGSEPTQATQASAMEAAPEVPVSVTPPTLDIEEEETKAARVATPVVSVTRSDLPPAPPRWPRPPAPTRAWRTDVPPSPAPTEHPSRTSCVS